MNFSCERKQLLSQYTRTSEQLYKVQKKHSEALKLPLKRSPALPFEALWSECVGAHLSHLTNVYDTVTVFPALTLFVFTLLISVYVNFSILC